MKRNAMKYMGTGAICVALFFLFNPDIIIIDILPNFIGYILICAGLSQLGAMYDVLEEAYIGFRRMIFVDIAKFLSIFVLFGLIKGNEQPFSMLLFAFIFGILEFMILIPAVVKLFDGVIYLASRMPANSVVFQTSKNSSKTKIEKLKIFTVVFIIIKTALAVLPEATALSIDGMSGINNKVSIYEFIAVFRTFSVILVTIIGIIWLVNMLSILFKIRKDSVFIDAVKEKYNTEVSIKDSLFIKKDLKMIVILFSVAIVFFIDFRIEITQINIIPNAICALLLIFAASNLKNYSKYKKHCIISASFFTVLSALAEYFTTVFNFNYSAGQIYKSQEAMIAYTKLLTTSILSVISFFVTIFFIIQVFKEIISVYTGFSIGGEDSFNKPYIEELHKSLTRKLYIVGFLAGFAAITEVLYSISILYKGYNHSNFIVFYTNTIPIFDFLVTIVFIVAFIRTLFNIYDEIENKYILM